MANVKKKSVETDPTRTHSLLRKDEQDAIKNKQKEENIK